jgi:predicted nucleic acid-binding protein
MTGPHFVDTNVLIYAHDVQAGQRHEVAKALVTELWRSRGGILSTQVLQEFYVNVTRKIPKPLPRGEARRILRQYSRWPVVAIAPADVLAASELEERHQLAFWDALILVAARRGGAVAVLSEDLASGSVLEGVRIVNPFLAPPDSGR